MAKSAVQIAENSCETDPVSVAVIGELPPAGVTSVDSSRQEVAHELKVVDDLPEGIPIQKEEINAIEAHLGRLLDKFLDDSNKSQNKGACDE